MIRPVEVVRFREIGLATEVARALDAEGVRVRPVTIDRALARASDERTVTITVVDEAGTVSDARWPRLLASRATMLAVVAPGLSVDTAAFAAIAEILVWPFTIEEFRFRLARAAPSADEAVALISAAATETLSDLLLIGTSPAFRACMALVHKTAAWDAPVLITGETGTGKELAARAIHYLGVRRSQPFVPVNCGALPETLFENEFFGHVRGAYTSAITTQPGLVKQADGGTLFLDEIDALSLRSQAALLRFLQDRQYRPLGAAQSRQARVRLIAATNADLPAAVVNGTFREDLLFRLDVLSLRVPALRERPGDIPLLAAHVLERLSSEYNQPPKRLGSAALAYALNHAWPGNIRELENWLHRAFVLSEGAVIEAVARASPAPGCAPRDRSFRAAKARAVAEFERRYLAELMGETSGNVSAASRRAGTERRALARLLRKHGIDAAVFRRAV